MKFLASIVMIVVVVIGGLIVAPNFIDWSQYKEQGQAQIKAFTGYDLMIDGDFALAFLPYPHARANGVRVVNTHVSPEPFVQFEKLSIGVAVAPLFRGQVQVSEVTLEKPVFDVRIDKNGKGNWLSPELEMLLAAGQGEVPSDETRTAEISFDRVRVSNGAVRYFDAAKGQETKLEAIDLSLNAESLQGPFNGTGTVNFAGQTIAFDAKSGKIENTSLSLNVAAQQGENRLDYKGVLSFGEVPAAQGEVAVNIPALELQGFVTANPRAVTLKDMALVYAGKTYKGEFDATLQPLKVKAAFEDDGFLGVRALQADIKQSVRDARTLFDITAQLDALNVDALPSSGSESAARNTKPLNLQQTLAALPIDMDFDVRINELIAAAQTTPNLRADGKIRADHLDVRVQAHGGSVQIQGNDLAALQIELKHPNMTQILKQFRVSAPAYGSFSAPIDLAFMANISDSRVMAIDDINGNITKTSVTGNLRYDMSLPVPAASGALRFGPLELINQGSSASGQAASSASIDTSFLRMMNADFDISAESLLYETWDLKKPSLKVRLQNGVLEIKDLHAGMFDGQIGVQGMLAAASGSPVLDFNSNFQIDDVNLGQIAYALSGSRRVQADGKASLAVNMKGQGGSQQAILQSLSGDASLSGQDVVMKGFDLAGLAGALLDSNKPLSRIQQLVNASSSGGETAFDTIDGEYRIENGIVNIESMAMDGPAAGIVSQGRVNLPRGTIDTIHTVTLKNARKVEPFDVSIKGSLDNPANTFGSGLFESYWQQKLQDKVLEKAPDLLGDSATEKLQQFGILPKANTGAKQDQTEPASGSDAPANQDPAEEAVRGLIKGLFD